MTPTAQGRFSVAAALLVFLLTTTPPGWASAETAAADFPIAKSSWRIAAVHCAGGCPKEIRTFFTPLLGREVRIAPDRLEAPFLDRCAGPVRQDFKSMEAREVVELINAGAAPGRRKTTPADLKLAGRQAVLTAWLACEQGAAARLLSIEPDRILLLFEQQSVVELR